MPTPLSDSELLTLIKLQLDRIEQKLKSGPVHASGPRRPSLSQLEATPPKKP